MKILKIIALVILLISCKKETPKSELKPKDYSKYYAEAKKYCVKNNLNTKNFIFIDLGLHSGLNRFFVYNFATKKVTNSYVVSHGCGDNMWSFTSSKEDALISNEKDSHCSSVGKYKIGARGISQWGIKVNYLLYGQDKTNSNAVNRAIVLHSWEKISSTEVYPDGTPEGWGCPAVGNDSMKEIDAIISKNKNMLMWIVKD